MCCLCPLPGKVCGVLIAKSVPPWQKNRTINLNTQYIVLFKIPRDQQQVAHLARQMYPSNWRSFLDTFKSATKEPDGYLLVNLKQDTEDDYRLKTKVIKGVNNLKTGELTAGIANGDLAISTEKESTLDRRHCSCIVCGSIFASSRDVQQHIKRGCPKNKAPPVKKLCMENKDNTDGAVWDKFVQRVYDRYHDQYVEKVESYKLEGSSNLESREKATRELFLKYRKGITKAYANFFTTMHSMQKSEIHREVMEDIQTLMNN